MGGSAPRPLLGCCSSGSAAAARGRHPDPCSVREECGAAAGRPSEPREPVHLRARLARRVGLGASGVPLPRGSPSPRRSHGPRTAARPRRRPLTSAGEHQAPRGPRTPSHGAGSREPGSALLRPPRPRRSSGPWGPSADAHRQTGPGPGGRAEPSAAGGPAPGRGQKGGVLSYNLPSLVPSDSGSFLSFRVVTKTSDKETDVEITGFELWPITPRVSPP